MALLIYERIATRWMVIRSERANQTRIVDKDNPRNGGMEITVAELQRADKGY
jgi:hypothetical protein